jgi:hypothetical protein
MTVVAVRLLAVADLGFPLCVRRHAIGPAQSAAPFCCSCLSFARVSLAAVRSCLFSSAASRRSTACSLTNNRATAPANVSTNLPPSDGKSSIFWIVTANCSA